MFRPAPEIAPGFTAEDYEDEDEDAVVWPENYLAYSIFATVSTQWVHATAGMNSVRVALYYPSIYPLLDRATKTDEEWQELLQDIRIMESAAIKEMSKHIKTK